MKANVPNFPVTRRCSSRKDWHVRYKAILKLPGIEVHFLQSIKGEPKRNDQHSLVTVYNEYGAGPSSLKRLWEMNMELYFWRSTHLSQSLRYFNPFLLFFPWKGRLIILNYYMIAKINFKNKFFFKNATKT